MIEVYISEYCLSAFIKTVCETNLNIFMSMHELILSAICEGIFKIFICLLIYITETKVVYPHVQCMYMMDFKIIPKILVSTHRLWSGISGY